MRNQLERVQHSLLSRGICLPDQLVDKPISKRAGELHIRRLPWLIVAERKGGMLVYNGHTEDQLFSSHEPSEIATFCKGWYARPYL